MYLYLSALDISELHIGLLEEDLTIKEYQCIKTPPEGFLLSIDAFFKKNTSSLDDVKRLIVVNGPGSFTSTRIITSIANAIIFSKKFPAITIENPEKVPLEDLIDEIKEKISNKQLKHYFIEPFYNRPPHITMPKKVS